MEDLSDTHHPGGRVQCSYYPWEYRIDYFCDNQPLNITLNCRNKGGKSKNLQMFQLLVSHIQFPVHRWRHHNVRLGRSSLWN